mgnify:CR=1 FL=1
MVYDDIKSADEQIRVLRSNMQTEKDANNVLTLERENKKRLLQLLRDCSEMADFTNYVMYDWRDVQKKLSPTDVAIEFVAIKSEALDQDNYMVALVLDSDMKTPVSIPVCTLADAKVMQQIPHFSTILSI